MPRALFFVDIEDSRSVVRATNTTVTSPHRSSQEKPPWKGLKLTELRSRSLEAEHVFHVHVGETVVPYVLLDPRKAVLPLSKTTGELVKQDGGWYGVDPLSLGYRMRRRWGLVNELWEEHKSRNNKLDLIGNIDYISKLSAQRRKGSSRKVRVVQTTSGHPTAALLLDPNAVIDTSLYSIVVDTVDEARYLTAIINSHVLEEMLEPRMAKGQYGPRHVHKHLWRLPIPEYDVSLALHRDIAVAGAAAAEGAVQVLSEVRAKREASGKVFSVRIARQDLRQWLSESKEGRRVEVLVGRLLKDQRTAHVDKL